MENGNPKSVFCEYQLPIPSRKTIEDADTDTKIMYLFDMNCIMLENQKKLFGAVEKREKDTFRERKRQRVIAGIAGMVAGFFGGLFNKIL